MTRIKGVDAVDSFRRALEIEADGGMSFSLDLLEELSNLDGEQRVARADSAAREILNAAREYLKPSETPDEWDDVAYSILSGTLLYVVGCPSLSCWEDFCRRTRSGKGIDEVLYDLEVANQDIASKSICKYISQARSDIYAKELFEAAKDGVQFLFELFGIADCPELARPDTIADVYEQTLRNCEFYEMEGAERALLNEVGVLRGVVYCMDIVGIEYSMADIKHFIELQQEMKADEYKMLRAVWKKKQER